MREDAVQAFVEGLKIANLEMAWVLGKTISASREEAKLDNDRQSSIPLGSLPASPESNVPGSLGTLENPNDRLVAAA